MWILVTLVATVFQTVRTAAQGRLRDTLSVNAAGYVRYVVGAPIAVVACAALFTIGGEDLPVIPPRFWVIVTVAGIAQIVGTIALLTAFDRRDYAIGTVYSKTEVIQVAVFSAVLVGEPLRPLGWIASIVVLVGVIRLAIPSGTPLRSVVSLGDRAAIAGVIAGGGFALAATGIRWASTSLGDHPAVPRAMLTLAAMNVVQTLVNGVWLVRREPTSLASLARHWRRTAPVGVLSVAGSASWAIAMSLETAAKVRTLGQAELLLAFFISHRWLREQHRAGEMVASALVLTGIVGVTIFG